MKRSEKYIPVIGLEVHAQLKTVSKIFAADSTLFGGRPNTQVSVITLGHPGVLPKLNKKALEYAIKMGLACESRITREFIFDRKNYFYPDLPKGYQITQDKTPICSGGAIRIKLGDGTEKKIALHHIHLEEDAGKSMHDTGNKTLVDLNRAGVPLIEMVTEPDLRSSEEAYLLMMEIRRILRYLDICDGNMEEGSLRCDANVSVMKTGDTQFGQKVEVKNMNSFKHVQRAIDYEIERQIGELEKGNIIISETRTFNSGNGRTYGMRTKETLNDYRYFPDPDLSPVEIAGEWLDELKAGMPSLPHEMEKQLIKEYDLPEYDARVLSETREIAEYFLEVCRHFRNPKAASNWIMGPVKSYLNDKSVGIAELPLPPEKLAELIRYIDKGKIAHATASKEIFPALLEDPDLTIEKYIREKDLTKDLDTSEILEIIDEVLKQHPGKVEQYRKGKKGLIGMFMGEVMKRTKGKADPKKTNELIRESLR